MKEQQQAGVRAVYPLGQLFPSKGMNVRRKKRTPQAIKRMAMSIHAFGGLLQELLVVPEIKDGKRTGRAEVIAGETRRLGLCGLRDGLIPDAAGFTDNYPVPVREVEEEQAVAMSATENLVREQMHPADQFEAFRQLNDQCGSVEHVAAVFGVEPQVVVRSLKLANASPKLLQLYRDDGMKLEQLMALSITDDHEAQERVWAAAKGPDNWQASPQHLRNALVAKEVPMGAALARWVGLREYEAAGGRVRTDLFNEDGGFLMDVELLQGLANAKLEKSAASVRKEGWAWVEVKLEMTYSDWQAFTRAQKSRPPLSEAERAELTALEAVRDEALAALDEMEDADAEDEDEDRVEELEGKYEVACDNLRKLQQRGELSWSKEVMALAGAIITIDQGKVKIERGLVRPEDKRALKKAMAPVSPAKPGARDEGATSTVGVSDALARCLTSHKTVALQRVIADNTQVALAALAHNLAQQLLAGDRARSALRLDAHDCGAEVTRFGEAALTDSRAWTELQALKAAWLEQMPRSPEALLPWLIALPQPRLCELLSLCSALTINAVSGDGRQNQSDALASAADLDMADWWEPTIGNFLGRVPKAQTLAAVQECVSPQAAETLAPLKKGDLVIQAETLIAGRRWLPALLRRKG